MTDFEKIIKVTRMAKDAADAENKVFEDKKRPINLLSLATCLSDVWDDLKMVSSMFDLDYKRTKIATEWYGTVLNLRTVGE